MSDSYNPLKSLSGLRQKMQDKITEAGERIIPGTEVAAPLAIVKRADTVCVLLKMLTDDGPVPPDIKGLFSATAIKNHVREDGGIFRGAYELPHEPESVVLVWADPSVSDERCLIMANMERPALERRYTQWTLGPFAAVPALSTPSTN